MPHQSSFGYINIKFLKNELEKISEIPSTEQALLYLSERLHLLSLPAAGHRLVIIQLYCLYLMEEGT